MPDPSRVCDLHQQLTGNTGSLTHWVRPGVEPPTSGFLIGFVSAVPRWELQNDVHFKQTTWPLCHGTNEVCHGSSSPSAEENYVYKSIYFMILYMKKNQKLYGHQIELSYIICENSPILVIICWHSYRILESDLWCIYVSSGTQHKVCTLMIVTCIYTFYLK